MKSGKSSLRGSKILIIDDHRNIRVSVRMTLEAEGASVDEADNLGQARQALAPKGTESTIDYDVVLLDIRLPDGSGLDLLRELKLRRCASQIIVISGEGTQKEAFEATEIGAFDFVEKPFTPERILVSAKRCLDFHKMEVQNTDLAKKASANELFGDHPKIKEILTLIDKIAPTNGRVLITGESGTGKELIARAIHRLSHRASNPMIKVNCAAIPKNLMESELFGHEKGAFTGAIKTRQGVFERAHGGTLFLDEIGELELDMQSKLLRVLQNGEFNRVGGEKTHTADVRVVCATNRDLKAMVQQGTFREDLYYRLNVVSIHSPALRERPDDIPLLAQQFLRDACEEHALGQKAFAMPALSQLKNHNWPGNVRELRNIVERSAILSIDSVIDKIEGLILDPTFPKATELLAPHDGPHPDGPGSLSIEIGVASWERFHEHVDRAFLKFILHQTEGNISEAARVLELERAYLHRLLKKFGITR